MKSSVTPDQFKAHFARLLVAYPTRQANDHDKVLMIDTYWHQVSRCHWLTEPVLARGIEIALRLSEFMPTVKLLLDYCVEAERQLTPVEVVDEPVALLPDAVPTWFSDADAELAAPNGLRKAIDNGCWDRGTAYGKTWMAKRKEQIEAIRSRYRQQLGHRAVRDKFLVIEASSLEASRLETVVERDDIDATLRQMATIPRGQEGALRGTLEAALSYTLPFERY